MVQIQMEIVRSRSISSRGDEHNATLVLCRTEDFLISKGDFSTVLFVAVLAFQSIVIMPVLPELLRGHTVLPGFIGVGYESKSRELCEWYNSVPLLDMAFWRLREATRPAVFSAGLYTFQHISRSDSLLKWLRYGWGNSGWSADDGFLRALTHSVKQTSGPILECGSGLTTILLGVLAPGRTISLEHTPEWKSIVEESAARHSIPVNIQDAPLVSYGEYEWYSLPADISNNFGMVVCDGPPSGTRGGRYGLLPVAQKLLSEGAMILMDDAERDGEQKIIEQWKTEFCIRSQEFTSNTGKHAVLEFSRQAEPNSAASKPRE
jgi:hypothetical protein